MRWIVLLRAVNVGGTGKLGMAELRERLAQGGAGNVATYIQSGNIVMDHPLETHEEVADWPWGYDALEPRASSGHAPSAATRWRTSSSPARAAASRWACPRSR